MFTNIGSNGFVRRPLAGLFALAGLIALGACAPSNPPSDAELDRKHRFKPPYTVEHTVHRHLVPVSTARAEIDEQQFRDLYDFLVGVGVRTGDNVIVAARRSRLDRRDEVTKFLRRAGVIPDLRLIKEGAVSGDEDGYDNAILVQFDRYTPRQPDCGNWGEPVKTNFYNTSLEDFGCTTTAALQQQVAYPSSLIAGQPLTFPEGDVAAESVSRYRGRKTEAIKAETAASTN